MDGPCTRAIITHGLYTFYPLFDVKNVFSRSFLLEILAFCMISIQFKSGFKSRAGYHGAHTVYIEKENIYLSTISGSTVLHNGFG